jgi:hypothetical protein
MSVSLERYRRLSNCRSSDGKHVKEVGIEFINLFNAISLFGKTSPVAHQERIMSVWYGLLSIMLNNLYFMNFLHFLEVEGFFVITFIQRFLFILIIFVDRLARKSIFNLSFGDWEGGIGFVFLILLTEFVFSISLV